MTDTVAATAVRTAYLIEGRFFSSQARNFMRTRSLQRTRFGKIQILVNDTGVYELSPLEEITEEHLERGTTDHLASGISKSHACVVAADSLRRVRSGHE